MNRKLLLGGILLVFFIGGVSIVYSVLDRQPAETNPSQNNLPPPQTSTVPVGTSTQATSTIGIETYTNTEFGFEFQYPENWKIAEKSFNSPFSKFNLILEKDLKSYNPFNPSILINIVTPDFADRAIISRKNLETVTSDVVVGGTEGIKYEYEFESIPQIDIDISFREYRILLGGHKEYENVFNQIIATFKFLK